MSSSFESLTLALEDWFATPIAKLPDALRQRVVQEFFPMPWDTLSADQRRSVALQLDYQHDPAMENDRQDWWDFFQRMDAVKAQITDWNAVATPTAGELALKERRLVELQQELARMDAQVRHARGDYFPQRELTDAKDEAPVAAPTQAVRYIAYPKAMHQLAARLGATPEELAAWMWLGPEHAGLAAYVNANELEPPPRFHFGLGGGYDYVAPLMAAWFVEEEIAHFEPTDRYITGAALVKRWGEKPGLQPEAFILAKIRESRLQDIHPMYGGTRGTFHEYADFPPLESGLFSMSEVAKVEAEDFSVQEDSIGNSANGEKASIKEPSTASKARRPETASAESPTQTVGLGSPEWRRETARAAANAKHAKPGGSRDKKRQIREVGKLLGLPVVRIIRTRIGTLRLGDLKPRQTLTAEIVSGDGAKQEVPLLCRIDTLDELEYYRNGGILHYVLRKLAA